MHLPLRSRHGKRFVTTRGGAVTSPSAPAPDTEPIVWPHENDESDEMDDVDIDVFGPHDNEEDGFNPPNERFPAPLTFDELAEEQLTDDFCQTVLARQERKKDSNFFEDTDGLLKVSTRTIRTSYKSLYRRG